MTVNTGGPIRGFLGRWLMRLEAAGSILRMSFLGVTAASTLTSALALIGWQQYAPYVLGAGLLGTFVFAFAYTELGVFNRKNRERADFGDNYSGPTMAMDSLIEARQLAYLGYVLQNGQDMEFDELDKQMQDISMEQWQKLRDGLDKEHLE